MKTLALLVVASLLHGCAALGMLGIGASDVLPSLKYCEKVRYERTGITMKVQAECQVPAGG